jgi:DNA-binding transcriptional LysR family regulator
MARQDAPPPASMQQMLSHLLSCSSMHDLRRLRAFHAVAEHRSFSAAALALGYAQSVVSHHVAALEAEVGLTLIDRARRPIGLTDAGERLLTHAVAVLGQVAAAEDEIRALAGLETGRLRVGAFLTACTEFLPAALARFARAHPGVDVHVEQIEPADALRSLRAGELDLILTWSVYGEGRAAADDDGVRREHLADDPYRMVLPAGHRLARRRRVAVADLARERFIAPPRAATGGEEYRDMLDRTCAAAGFAPDIAYEVGDVTVGRAFVAAGLAVGILPELSVPQPRPDLAVKGVPGLDPFRTVEAAWMERRTVPALAPMVRELAKAAALRLPSSAVG